MLKSVSENSIKLNSEKEKDDEDFTGITGLICGILAVALAVALIILLLTGFSGEMAALYALLYLFGFLFAVGAIIFGSINVSKNKKDPGKYENSYMGHIAKITGIVSAAALVFVGIVVLVIFILFILLFG